ncbi:MAG TPA: hypothetical protein VLG38_05780, partial [Gammaproteobacteria bacterium]|nr:hypothetical protein [Gammaproteobacteria bacterium]
FNDYIATNPPAWLEDDQQVTWQQQLAYAEQMLQEVNDHWRDDLARQQFEIQDDCLVFTLDQLPNSILWKSLDLEIFNKPNKITLIDAPRNSGQSKHAQQMIIDAWIYAALKQADPPQYVWLEPNKPVKYASIFTCLQADTVVYGTTDMHARLLAEYESYLQGQQIVRNWFEVSNRLRDKYQDKGGIAERINQLHTSLKDAKAQSRHMQVLNSIWIRQKELVTEWSKVFDFIPVMQKQRMQRLYTFFKQNFVNENVEGCTQTQLDDLLNEKVRRAENNERMVGDALHQVENDQYQEQLVREKCLQWCGAQQIACESIDEIKQLMHDKLWGNLAHTALLYWQQDFAAKQGYADFLNCYPQAIDTLIVEHAEYISPMQAVELLALSKRAIVMGNYNAMCNPRFAVHIDYELTQHFGLVENDADFEDLQFDGILGSVGNMWNMVAKDREADEFFTAVEHDELEYAHIDVRTSSAAYRGSLVNQGTVSATIDWLNKHATERDVVTIYTCFAGQAQLLREALHGTSFAHVPIRMMQELCIETAAINIFVPVYSVTDPGPYVFDRGAEMFEQLVTNTQRCLVTIGDMRIFNPKLHSASGKFAQSWLPKMEVEF